MLGTSDAWSTIHIIQRTREPAYYIYCRLTNFKLEFLRQQEAEKSSSANAIFQTRVRKENSSADR